MDTKPMSPVPPKVDAPQSMTFPEAMKAVIDGKKITRIEWGNKDYCFLNVTYLSISRNGKVHQWLVNDGDMQATDWIITVPESN